MRGDELMLSGGEVGLGDPASALGGWEGLKGRPKGWGLTPPGPLESLVDRMFSRVAEEQVECPVSSRF